MQLRAEEISQIIKKQIQNFDKAALVTETGTVLATGDGIARVYGLQGAMAGELVEFPGGFFGLVLNLEQDNVGVALFGDPAAIRDGDTELLRATLTEEHAESLLAAPSITAILTASR